MNTNVLFHLYLPIQYRDSWRKLAKQEQITMARLMRNAIEQYAKIDNGTQKWNQKDINYLLSRIGRGYSYIEVGKILNRTAEACKSKYLKEYKKMRNRNIDIFQRSIQGDEK